MLVKSGTVVMLERGEWHYANIGPYRILRDFDEREYVERFLAQWKPKPHRTHKPSVHDFGKWLVSIGAAEEMRVMELDIDAENSDRRFDKG